MSQSNFTEELNREAGRQIIVRDDPAADVSQHLGVGQHSLYEKWPKAFSNV